MEREVATKMAEFATVVCRPNTHLVFSARVHIAIDISNLDAPKKSYLYIRMAGRVCIAHPNMNLRGKNGTPCHSYILQES